MWEAVITPSARKDLLKLEKAAAKQIITKVKKTLANPERHFKKLVDSDYCKLRAGDYRIGN